MREQLEYMKLCLGMEEEPRESLWVRTKERTDKVDVIVGVYRKPPDQEERADKALYRQTGTA